MKAIVTTLFIFFLCAVASAQWSVIYTNSIAPIEEFRSCFFTGALNGVVVGAQTVVGNPATIRRTTNGGISWTSVMAANTDTLRSVWFTNDTTGFACGAKGRIIRTFDTGVTWDTVASGVSELLRGITFPTPQTGYICGANGLILKSADSGNTWVQQTNPLAQDLINITFLNQDTGYACSSLGTFLSGYVIRTYDGGTTWDTVYYNAQGLLGIAIADANTIVAGGGNQTIVRSIDGGQSWSTVYTGNAGTSFRSAWFTSPSTGFMVGDIGSLFKTTNGGATWTPITLVTAGLLGMHFQVADTGYVVGSGTILKYITPCTPPAPAPISSNETACSLDTSVYCVPSIPGVTYYQWTVPAGNTIVNGQGDSCITIAFGNQTSGNITCFAINPCGNSDTTVISVVVQVTPAAPNISMVGNQLMSSTANNIQWNLNGVPILGANNQYYTPTQNGNYTVTYTNSAGCSATSAPYALLNVSVKELFESGISIYPNPADNKMTVQIIENVSDISVNLCDMTGRSVLRSRVSGKRSIDLDISRLENGIYYVTILTETKKVTSQVVIMH